MSWFKVDDSFPTHPKVLAIPRKQRTSAIGLWTLAGIWCAQQLTDGHLGPHMVEELSGNNRDSAVLVRVGLWEETDGGGYLIHDYLKYNPSAEDVRADQARKHEARARAGKAGGIASGVARRKHEGSKNEANAKQNEAPTRPDPIKEEELLSDESDGSAETVDPFDEFWRHYPRKDAKVDARKAWKQITKTTPAQDVIDGLTAYQFKPERQYQPLPASWLRGRRWEDEAANARTYDPAQLPEPGMGWSDSQLDMVLGADDWTPAPCPAGEGEQMWNYRQRAIHRATRIKAAEKAVGRAA